MNYFVTLEVKSSDDLDAIHNYLIEGEYPLGEKYDWYGIVSITQAEEPKKQSNREFARVRKKALKEHIQKLEEDNK